MLRKSAAEHEVEAGDAGAEERPRAGGGGGRTFGMVGHGFSISAAGLERLPRLAE
jgi:hypothetical protein